MGNLVAREIALTTGSPTVMFGTKRPSITSTCRIDAPAFSTVEISSPSREKSAERIDGAISIIVKNYGVGVRTGGRRLVFVLLPARFAGAVLEFVCAGVAFEFALPFVARFVLRF